jgi:anti-anti-sigma factor
MLGLSVDRVTDRVFVVTGELDGSTTGLFDSAVAPARREGEPVVLDLAGVTFVDSSGVRSLIRLALSLVGIGLILRDPSPRVVHILELRGLDAAGLWAIEAAAV